MRGQPHPEQLAVAIYDILVMHCGASDGRGHARENFVRSAVEGTWTEHRFCGSLGSGGKIWNEDVPYVTCYQEDKTPVVEAMIEEANAALKALWDDKQENPW